MPTAISNLRAFTRAMAAIPDPIDLTNASSTIIYDLAPGGSYKVPVIGFRVDVTTASFVTAPAVISVGTNSSDYDDIVKILAIPGISNWSYEKFFDNPILIPNNVDISAKVVVAGAASSFEATVFVYIAEYQI